LFSVNDIVVHPYHGVGKVTRIEKEELLGDKKTLYYIKMEKFMLKIDEEHAKIIGLRKLISKDEALKILSSLENPLYVEKDNWRKLYLKFKQEIKKDLKTTAKIMKKLIYFSRIRLLKPEEVKLMFLAKKILIEELSHALNTERKKIMEKINYNLKTFLKRMGIKSKNALAS